MKEADVSLTKTLLEDRLCVCVCVRARVCGISMVPGLISSACHMVLSSTGGAQVRIAGLGE